MGLLDQTDPFVALWAEVKKPLGDLEQRLAALEKGPSRAEVAGAVEVVPALPLPGQAGRVLFSQAEGFAVDYGSEWLRLYGPPSPGSTPGVAANVYVSTALSSWSYTTLTALDASQWGIVYTPVASTRVLVLHMGNYGVGTNRGFISLTDGSRIAGDATLGLLALDYDGAKVQTTVAWIFDTLTPGTQYEFSVMVARTPGGGNVNVSANQPFVTLAIEV